MEDNKDHNATLLRETFNKFDINGNGYLDSTEITKVLQELGVTVSSEDLDTFFKEVDANHDNQISFEEFCVWYKNGKGAKAGALQSKFLSALKQYKRDVKKSSKHSADEKKNVDNFHVGVSLGHFQEAKSKIEYGTLFGSEAADKFTAISEGLEIEQPGSIIFQFSSDKPAEAKDGVLAFFTSALETVQLMGVVPPNVPLDKLKITATNDDKHVRVALQLEHEMVAAVSGQVDFFANVFLEGQLSGSLNLGVHLNTSIGDLVSETDSALLDQVLKGGAVDIEFRLPHMVAEFGRNMLQQNIGSLPPPIQAIYQKAGPLTTMRNAEVKFEFDTNDVWKNTLGGFVPPIKFADFLPQLQAMNIPEMAAMAFPPLAEFLEIAEKQLNSDLKIYIRGPQALAHIHLKTEGLGNLWTAMKSQ